MAVKRIYVGLPPEAHRILLEKYKGRLGTYDAEIVRNIVLIFLSERGYFKNFIKGEGDDKP